MCIKNNKKMLAILKYFATIDLPEADSNFTVSKNIRGTLAVTPKLMDQQ